MLQTSLGSQNAAFESCLQCQYHLLIYWLLNLSEPLLLYCLDKSLPHFKLFVQQKLQPPLLNQNTNPVAQPISISSAGDRLNFGLAAELAKAEGFNVEVVIVGDDCSLPGTGLAGRRGIAGTIFVHKARYALSIAESNLPAALSKVCTCSFLLPHCSMVA